MYKIPLLTLLAVVLVASLATPGLAQPPNGGAQETVPINGLAYYATEPTGPDFEGVTLVPFQAENPTRAAWEATQAQNELYLAPEAVPQNVQVSQTGWFTYASNFLNDFSEVMVYLDPTDPDHLLGSSKFFYDPPNYGFFTGVFESYDGGHTWAQFQPAGIETYSLTSDPVTTFDHLGNGYFTLLTRTPTGLDMLKKPVGMGWQSPVVVDRTTYTDKQWIMGDQDPQGISPYAGNLYMSWTDVGTSRIVFARSTDGNVTWSSPSQLASSGVQGSIPGVAPDGTVYVVYGRNIFYGPSPGTIEIVKSTNGGASFGGATVVANITAIPWGLPNPFGGTNFRSPASLPAFAVSPSNGYLYAAWADYRHGDADIYFARSTDGGSTWDTAQRLNDDPLSNGMDQWQPQVSVAPNGRVAVMWFDRRLPCPDEAWIPPSHVGLANACIDTFMTRSFDDGQTWVPNIRASVQTWDWTLHLPITSGGDGFIGDYQGIASNNDYDFPFWNATADLGQNTGNFQQVFVAMVPLLPDLSPSTKSVAPATFAAGDTLTYTIVLENGGYSDAAMVTLSDTMPLSTTYVGGSLAYPPGSGVGGYDPATDAITWTGAVSVGLPVTVTFQVDTDPALAGGAVITNTAHISDGAGLGYERLATAVVSSPPFIAATYPADGQADVPLAASLVVTFSQAMDTGSLLYTVTPDPGGWVVAWSGGDMVATLAHDDWSESQPYTVTLAAQNPAGQSLMPGPAPNPWSFATADPPPYIVSTSPADGQSGVPVNASLVITFSEPVVTATLAYTVAPDPGGWAAAWDGGSTVVTLAHAGLAHAQPYSVEVAARDLSDQALAPGPAPNPWSFVTAGLPYQRIYLPLVVRGH